MRFHGFFCILILEVDLIALICSSRINLMLKCGQKWLRIQKKAIFVIIKMAGPPGQSWPLAPVLPGARSIWGAPTFLDRSSAAETTA